jgi:hypothetical protein
VKKGLLLGVGVVLGLALIPFFFLKLSFGPIHDTVRIDLGTEGNLVCDETYSGDFANEFYDVKMILETSNGMKHDIGSVTFHNQDWRKRITAKRVGDWIVFPMERGNLVQIKFLNTVNGQLNDTVLAPYNLGRDSMYQERNDKPVQRYPGSSNLEDVSNNTIEVNYEYKAKAVYPAEIQVSQRVIYEISPTKGRLQTKEIKGRVAQ